MRHVPREHQHTFGIFMAGGTWCTEGERVNENGLRGIHYHTLSESVLGCECNTRLPFPSHFFKKKVEQSMSDTIVWEPASVCPLPACSTPSQEAPWSEVAARAYELLFDHLQPL